MPHLRGFKFIDNQRLVFVKGLQSRLINYFWTFFSVMQSPFQTGFTREGPWQVKQVEKRKLVKKPHLRMKTLVDAFMWNFAILFSNSGTGGEKSNIVTFEVAFDLMSFFFSLSLFKIPSVVTQSFFPCWFLLLVFHVAMCLDRQWNIADQNDEWILMDSCKNTDNHLFCAAWSHHVWHMKSAESSFQLKNILIWLLSHTIHELFRYVDS